MIKMLWKSIAQDKGCLPLDLLILNVALAFFSAILAGVAFFQLVRIHLREKEWTRQKVLHDWHFQHGVDLCHQANDEEDDDGENSTQQTLLENSTNKFGSSNTDGNRACCSFQNLHVGSHQNFVVAVVLLVFILMVSFAVIIWIGAREK